VLIVVGSVLSQALWKMLLSLSRVRYVSSGAIIWCQVMLCSAAAVKAVDVCHLVLEVGNHVLIAAASATNGDNSE
jgi:hypothetical protein